jgi:large subunit ribosomal protein L14
MIQKESRLKVIDNSGGKEVLVFGIKGRSGRGSCSQFTVGDIVKVTIKSAIPHSKVKKGEKCFALIARTKYPFKSRSNGQYFSFNENSAILLKDNYDMIGTIVFGDVPREICKQNFNKKRTNAIKAKNIDNINKILSMVSGSVL